ncbi:DUF3006 domain-containing protein [Clostridium folliculivorans]|uniref:DUF3006 domain-containing protein n=1 Tax=Clostridium folliculivorans TaxID=2886038 RepID=UPI0021C329F5|nr:DUF3006 domain-containing protein [Clostridium folliculivorans]GKU32617.1 hypothetical protein CFB3_47250 [Clostridium folliculivorans]
MKLSKAYIIIDRIEDNIAVCEVNEESFKINVNNIEGVPKEGDVLVKKDSIYYIDRDLTNKRKSIVEDLMKGMWNDGEK